MFVTKKQKPCLPLIKHFLDFFLEGRKILKLIKMTLNKSIYNIMMLSWDDDDVFVRRYFSKLEGHVHFQVTYSSELH